MRALIELDLHLLNFTPSGCRARGGLREAGRAHDEGGSGAGFSSVTLMDHYDEILLVGRLQQLGRSRVVRRLAGLAAPDGDDRPGRLVGGVMYRKPVKHAKTTTMIQHHLAVVAPSTASAPAGSRMKHGGLRLLGVRRSGKRFEARSRTSCREPGANAPRRSR